MNYIKHLNAFFSVIKNDNRLTASHVSLYLALFQYWNFNRFQNPFAVYRENMMQLSKIGSKNTYHKCIKELHQAHYILYHPAVSKYQPVKISMIRLDIKHEATKQLELFATKASPLLQGEDLGGGFSPNTGTSQVPILTAASPKIDTPQVPNLGHSIKPNNKQENCVSKTHTDIFKKNKKWNEEESELSHGPKLAPALSEVEEFFLQNNYPADEAKKFFHYNNSKNWMLNDKLAIKNWKSIAHKWMLSPKKQTDKTNPPHDPAKDIQYLYESFLEGKKIFHLITIDHFDHIKPQLTDETMQQALQERIKQVTGTNQHSINLIWEAYLTNDPNNHLVQKDKPNVIALAKRFAVINYFNNLKKQTT